MAVRSTAAVTLALLLNACASTPAVDPVAVKQEDMDRRLGRVEAVVSNQSLVDLSRRIDALEAQLRTLRGSIEEGQNAGSTLGKQQRDLYADLNRRLAALESGSPAASSPATGAAAAAAAAPVVVVAAGSPGTATDQADYDRALAALRAGKYADTIALLRNFGARHPGTQLADNAQYWLGEAYYVSGDYDSALTAFKSVGERWPNSRKVPDALLKQGYTQQMLQDSKGARATLQQVIVRFPDSDAAKLARERLAQLTAQSR